MKTQEMAVSINRAENRFELEMDGKLSYISYFPKDDRTLVLTHTEVNPNLGRQGVGSLLVIGTFDYIERHNLSVVPSCAFVAAFLRRHPEYYRFVSPVYQNN